MTFGYFYLKQKLTFYLKQVFYLNFQMMVETSTKVYEFCI